MSQRPYSFFAMLARMKYIERWALMRNSEKENISQHSLEVAIIAHALALLGNKRLGKEYDAEHAAMLGIYHDCTEILTGDMPTREEYEPYFIPRPQDRELHLLVKAADKISALIKCIEEAKAGNQEFHSAETTIKTSIAELRCPEADLFMEEFLPTYQLTLDELS